MIKCLVAMGGKDVDGNDFSCAPGECVTLDEKSEKNYIDAGLAVSITKKEADAERKAIEAAEKTKEDIRKKADETAAKNAEAARKKAEAEAKVSADAKNDEEESEAKAE